MIGLNVYIGANLFFAGYYLATSYHLQDTNNQRALCLLWCFGLMLFGSIVAVLLFVLAFMSRIIKMINDFFQVSFWFSFYLTKKWDNLEKHQLETINRVSLNIRNKNNLKDRIFRHCTSLINKRNNHNIEPVKTKK